MNTLNPSANPLSPAQKSKRIVANAALESFAHTCRVVAAAVGMIATACSLAAAECYQADDFTVTTRLQVLKGLATGFTAILVLALVGKYRTIYRLQVTSGFLHKSESFCNQYALIQSLAWELFICVLHAPVCVSGTYMSEVGTLDVVQTLDGTLAILTLFRVYLLVPILRDILRYNSPTATMLAKWNRVKFDNIFTFKAMLDQHPLRAISVLLAACLVILAYALRTFERNVCRSPEVVLAGYCGDESFGFHDMDAFANAMWATFITSMTVGYGDNIPFTSAGRMVVVISSLLGVCLIAVLVSTVNNQLSLKPHQRHALTTLNLHLAKLKKRNAAARLVAHAMLENFRRRRKQGRLRSPPPVLQPGVAVNVTTNPMHSQKEASLKSSTTRLSSLSLTPRRRSLVRQAAIRLAGGEFLSALRQWRGVSHAMEESADQDSSALLIKYTRDISNTVSALQRSFHEMEAKLEAMTNPEAALTPTHTSMRMRSMKSKRKYDSAGAVIKPIPMSASTETSDGSPAGVHVE
jgi:hypothetical protein